MKKVVWFVFFLIMAVSCLDEPDCFRQNINLMGISFKKMFDGRGDTVAIKSITATASGDRIFVDHQLTSNVSLDLNYLAESTSFTIVGVDIEGVERVYSLTVNHKSKAQFVSEDCGQRFIVTDLELATHENFDSIRLVSNAISNPAQANIDVYRCPRNNVMRLNFRQLYMDTVRHGKADLRTINSISNGATLLYNDTTLSSALFVLDPAQTNATLTFNLDKNEDHTIGLSYLVADEVILEKCGSQKLLHDLEATSNDFPLLRISNDSIYDPPRTNFEVLRCPETNIMKVLFKQNKGNSKVADTLFLKSLTADYLTEPIYDDVDTIITSYALPLNPSASVNSTKFTFTFRYKNDPAIHTSTLEVTYTITPTLFHTECSEQPVYSTLAVKTADFTTTIKTTVPDPKVKFPAVNNIEIILQ